MSIKRILAILIAVVLMGSLSACDAPSPIAGTWVGTLDYSQILQEEFSREEFLEEASLEGICLKICFEFRSDGSFTTQIDKESAQHMVDTLLNIAVDTLAENLEAQGNASMAKEDLRQLLEGQIDLSALTAPLDFVFGSGYYVYRNNCIYIGSQPRSLLANPEENAAEVMSVTLQDGSITVTQLYSQGNSAQELLPGLIPFTLVKQ